MSLEKYNAKRSFDKTPEPKGGKADDEVLRFVVQKHAASHLHYDFRLEMRGVLKSWAVPKGPATDPEIKRLAMMVEDHPYDYRSFEGIIPAGEYGGGTVIVWDEGTYEPLDAKGKDKKAQEQELMHGLHAGNLKFVLKGKKLKGEFVLVKTHGMGENGWLLIKHNDKYASKDDITLKDKSVISRKTIEKVAATSKNIYGQKAGSAAPEKAAVKKKAAAKPKAPAKKAAIKKKVPAVVIKLLKKANEGPFPVKARPMLAVLAKEAFDHPGWIYEVKWDGYRALAMMNEGSVELKSRNDKSFDKKFYPVFDALGNWKINAVVDGEVVVLNEYGVSHFSSLQNWRSEADGDLIFYVFDLLWLDGRDLCPLPLHERQAILRELVPEEGIIRLSQYFKATGSDFMKIAGKFGLEGIMAKREDSAYLPGERSGDWRKIKINKRHEVVIGGYTRNEDTKKLFSSLLVGVFEDGVFQYTGKIGTGFTEKMQREMMEQFKSLIIKESPFGVLPDINKPSRFRPDPPKAKATWLKPELVCRVSFAEMTTDGVMRHPAFEGMSDKKAPAVGRAKRAGPTASGKEQQALAAEKVIVPVGKKARATLLNPTDETQTRKVAGHDLKFTNLSKLYWPDDGVSKRDMINYYYQVAPFMLPYLKDRPMSLNRHPNGIKGISFYQKDVTGKVPGWIETMPYRSEADPDERNFLVCTDEASLLYMASLACIEINPWSSTIKKPDNPDWCIIDLDPDKKNSFDQVIEAAQVTKGVLDAIGVPSYCKTSGSTGLHIYIPLGAKYSYEQSKEFARVIVTLVQRELPLFTSIERIVSNRKGKMYLDFLQNRPQATLAAPYSLRPKPGATVSMPLHWDEVKKGLQMRDFTIFNAIARVQREGDIFKPVLGKGIDLEKVIRKLSGL